MLDHEELTKRILGADPTPTVKQLASIVARLATTADRRQTQGFLHFKSIEEPINDVVAHNATTFQYDAAYSVYTDNSLPHVLIEGDNLAVLAGMKYTHEGKVDIIYIDPPYNTGSEDFRYNDSFVSDDDASGSSKWLSFMEPRLRLARQLLRKTGVVIIAIGNDEDHRLKALLDNVFGRNNFISRITWAGDIKNDSRFVSNTSDYMYVYAKSMDALKNADVRFREPKTGAEEMLEAAEKIWESTQDAELATKAFRAWFRALPVNSEVKKQRGNALYNNIDESGRLYGSDNLSWPGGGGPLYDVLHPITGQPVAIPSGGWRAKEETMQQWVADGRILFNKDHTTVARYKRFLTEVMDIVPRDFFFASRADSNKELASILGPGAFPFPKDRNVLARWIDAVTPQFRKDKSAYDPIVVMDFFAGSGTTGHAVAQLNAHDNVHRQCILVTNNEVGNKIARDLQAAGIEPDSPEWNARGIAREVTAVRMRAVITGVWADGKHEALGGNLSYFRANHFSPRGEYAVTSTDIVDRRLSCNEFQVHDFEKQSHATFALKENTLFLLQDEQGISVWYDGSGKKVTVVIYDTDFLDLDYLFEILAGELNTKFRDARKTIYVPAYEGLNETSLAVNEDDLAGEKATSSWGVRHIPTEVFRSWKSATSLLPSRHSVNYETMIYSALGLAQAGTDEKE